MRHLLFDKSAFQGLGDNAHALVRDAYSTITASTLLYEIGGDLAIDRQFKGKTPEERAAMLARKFGDRVETHRDWKHLCQRALLGENVLTGGPVIYNAVEAFTPDGRLVASNVERPDGSVVHAQKNWVELLASKSWQTRYPSRQKNLDAEVRALWGSMVGKASRVRRNADQTAGEAAVVAEVDRVLCDPTSQEPLIMWLVTTFGSSSEHHLWHHFHVYWKSRMRWEYAGRPVLKDFAPYAHHCARVQLLYLVGYEVWPKGREPNDLADIDYLRLLPFTDVFVSNDKFVRAMAKHLLRPNQVLLCSCRLEKEVTGTTKDEAKCQREHS